MYMRQLYLFGFLLISTLGETQSIWCNVDSMLNESKVNGTYDLFLNKVHAQQQIQSIKPRTEVWFQVVVHIVLREDARPISAAQVIQQIDVLNNDFAGKGENISHLLPEFEPLIADTGIRFCLATSDPQGKPTNGITNTFTTFTNIALRKAPGPENRVAIHYTQYGGKTGWDPTKYINIWVGEYGSILGSAHFPGTAPHPEEIGLVIDPRAFGSLGDAAFHDFYDRGHTLTHEMGHFFGLFHIWGGNMDVCDDSDDIDDTPNQLGPYFNCPSGTQMSCGVSNMYQNFMDLTDDRCLAAFTHGQSDRMHASIDAFYPNLGIEGPCHPTNLSFDTWYNQLIWAYDHSSRQYVIYHPDGYSAQIQVDVFSDDGRLILHDKWEDDQTYLLDLNSQASGIYFVRLSDGQHDMVRKVVSYY